MRQKFIISSDLSFISGFFPQLYMLAFKMQFVECYQGIQMKWSQYRDTGVTDTALVIKVATRAQRLKI